MNAPRPPQRIGELMLAKGLVTGDQITLALQDQRIQGQALGETLHRLGFVSRGALADVLSERLGTPSVALEQSLADPEALALVGQADAARWRILPLAWNPDTRQLQLATARPDDLSWQDSLLARLPEGARLACMLASEPEILAAIERHYGQQQSLDELVAALENKALPGASGKLLAGGNAVVSLIDYLICDAVKAGASDIHFEPEAGYLRIRYRIDGLLQTIRVLQKSAWPAMVVRIKIIAGLDIAENRAPQDGHLSLRVCGRPIDCRVSTLPTLHGENVVLRILDREQSMLPLAEMGLSAGHQSALLQLMARPEGMVLVTGPTGAGKTTTLYALLQTLDRHRLNIMTLEDPVEYPFPGLRQTSVSEAVKLDFANGVRALMRQDPDVILVGEIRDPETAAMAFRAAMTGHLVLATLHCNSAPGAIARLQDLGVPLSLITSNLNGILAQRLVRKLCRHCRQAYEASKDEKRHLGAPAGEALRLYRASACPACFQQGYRGRQAILEMLVTNDELLEELADGLNGPALARAARRNGYQGLAEDGKRRVLAGETSLAELQRVVALN